MRVKCKLLAFFFSSQKKNAVLGLIVPDTGIRALPQPVSVQKHLLHISRNFISLLCLVALHK